MTGRIRLIDKRLYVDGYDLSPDLRSIGPLTQVFDEATDDSVLNATKKKMPTQANISPGTANMIFDTTAVTGTHIVLPTVGRRHDVMIPQGIGAAPATADPVFVGRFNQLAYQASNANSMVGASIPWSGINGASLATMVKYATPWGILVHPLGTETYNGNAVAAIIDLNAIYGSATILGGYMHYQVTAGAGSGNITAAIKVQHCDTSGGVYADLLSSGVVNFGSGGTFSPNSGFVALGYGTAVKRYIIWAVSWTLATSLTFALAFVPNYI